jgi:photosystem II stability/assembly factor-like uncharacterized protein
MHTTIYAISESPKAAGQIWAGTDDGNVQLTRDAGKTWTNLTGNLSGVPKASWVSWIEASPHDAGTAFATFDRHTFGDMTPHVLKTTDFGKTWTDIAPANSGVRGYAHVIKQDVVNPNLLFLGTEFGLWVSLDGGAQWAQYKGGDMPSAAVRDIVVHPRDHDLVIATHGRGIWIVDDITPLRNLTREMLAKDAAFVDGRPHVQKVQTGFGGGWPEGDAMFSGPNPTGDMVITYFQKKRHIRGDLKLEILDASGKVLTTIPGSKRRGLSRANWDMRMPAPKVPTAASATQAFVGPQYLPGAYTVRLTKDKDVITTKINTGMDPRAAYNAEDRKANFDLSMQLYNMLADMTFAADRVKDVLDRSRAAAAKFDAKDKARAQVEKFGNDVEKIRKEIVATKEGGAITGEERIREKLSELYAYVGLLYDGRPAKYYYDRTDVMKAQLDDINKQFDALVAKDLPAVNKALAKKKAEPITPITRADWEKKDAPPATSGDKPKELFANFRWR